MTLLKRIVLTLLILFSLFFFSQSSYSQRPTDVLDRGLVAVKTDAGVFCSWRIMGEEYYDVTYNLYRDGTKLNSEPLSVSNFTDADGTEGSRYTVSAVVRGKEQAQSSEASVWAQKWLEITPDHGDLKSTYIPNDACCADVDGDGELEILLKFDNQSWASTSYQKAGYEGEYFIIEVYKLNGQKLWWIDLGPNMADFQNNEQNIVAYDWDQDGRAEAVMRAADGTVIHMADGTEYVIGDQSKNYLAATASGQWFVHEGDEFLVYMDGATGKPYQVMEYPLKRLEAGETDLNAAWGDGYGHRSTKHFFGAPCLDGRKSSIFLARGIYTRHKMIALDVNPETHELVERWRWSCNTPGSPWYGQGYHNFAIADVDWDGRDEICFGSMVIDDNGHGLSSTGLGHGDAQHHSDFNPYIHGHEIFACNEDEPSNNYRDATTSKLYYRKIDSADDGRCMAGNFTNDYPGAMAFSAHDTPISCVTNDHIDGLAKDGLSDNMRIYWDGDLLEECFNYVDGKNSAGGIYKYKVGLIERLEGSMTNNDTKGTPCYQGDILGDWREEVIMRTRDNHIRIYTTTIPTEWRIPTLWHDYQYRQAMVWQMCGYNQPPHLSYFLGELEGITQAPPPLTMTGRTTVGDGGSIGDVDTPNSHWLLAEASDATVQVQDGCSPNVLTVNTPSWVQGHDDNDRITTEYFTHTLKGGAFTGDMRLVKQGDGILVLPEVTETYTGPTDVWAGTLRFDGMMQNSHVWLNRFAVLESDGGKFQNGISMDYGSSLRPGEKGIETDSLTLGFGSRIVFDVEVARADCVRAGVLKIEKKEWQYGPKYSAPVFEICRLVLPIADLPYELEGKYLLVDAGKIDGSVDDIVLEGVDGLKASLIQEDGKIYLNVEALRQADNVRWDGGEDGIWDLADTENFLLPDGTKDFFVTGDTVIFDDSASQTTVTILSDVAPASIMFQNNDKDFILSGDGSIIGTATLTKRGSGNLTIENVNRMTGRVTIEDGVLTVASLANTDGVEYGNLGGVDNTVTLSGGTLAVSNTVVSSMPVSLEGTGGTMEVANGKVLTQNGNVIGTKKTVLHKSGSGTLVLGGTARFGAVYIDKGRVQGSEISDRHQYPDTVVIVNGSLKDPDNIYSYSSNSTTIVVPEGAKASWALDSRCDYTGKLTGAGELTVNVTSVRCNMQGDWSQFAGTLTFQNQKTGSYDPQLQWNNNYGLPKATVGGTFHNNGKDVTMLTLADKTSITGSGLTTVDHLGMTISKVKGSISNTYFEVAGTLLVSDSINITLKGTLKVGDQITLWKVGSLQTGSNLAISLPELPEGLYWDTSRLLTKEGRLKVTDTPTGIKVIDGGHSTMDNSVYDLSGRKVANSLDDRIKSGIYIQNGKKIVVRR